MYVSIVLVCEYRDMSSFVNVYKCTHFSGVCLVCVSCVCLGFVSSGFLVCVLSDNSLNAVGVTH